MERPNHDALNLATDILNACSQANPPELGVTIARFMLVNPIDEDAFVADVMALTQRYPRLMPLASMHTLLTDTPENRRLKFGE